MSEAVITRQKNLKRHVGGIKLHGSVVHVDPTQLLVSRRARNWCSRPLSGGELQSTDRPCGIGDKELKATKLERCGLQNLHFPSKETTIIWTLLYNWGFLVRNMLNMSILEAPYGGLTLMFEVLITVLCSGRLGIVHFIFHCEERKLSCFVRIHPTVFYRWTSWAQWVGYSNPISWQFVHILRGNFC